MDPKAIAGRFGRDHMVWMGATAGRLARFRQMRKPSFMQRWAKMAADARAIAMGTRDPSAKKTMLDIAADYDRLAKKSEELARRPGGKGEPKSD